MNRLKTKRILWTIAVLLVLSFIAAWLCHDRGEPKIIGDISAADVSEISKVSLSLERDALKEEMRILFKERKIGYALIKKFKRYIFVRVLTVQAMDSRTVLVAIGTETNEAVPYIRLTKRGDHWRYF